MRLNRSEMISILFAAVLIIWGIMYILDKGTSDPLTIPTSLLFFVMGIAYPIEVFKPEWSKPVWIIQGSALAIFGIFVFEFPENLIFIAIGGTLIVLSLLSVLGIISKKK